MDDRRGIVLCIFTFKRIFHNRFAQITVYITLSDSFIDRSFQTTAFKMHILSDLHKDHCHSRILTDGDHILPCDLQIVLKLRKHLLSDRGFFFLTRLLHGSFHILCQKMVGFYTHFPDIFRNIFNLYRFHNLLLCFIDA